MKSLAPGPRADTAVRVVTWTDQRAWDSFVLGARDGTIAHRWPWLDIVTACYGHQVIPLAAVRHSGSPGGPGSPAPPAPPAPPGLPGGPAGAGDSDLAGVLPLVLMRSRLFGRHLVSMPFLDSGGLCTDGDRAADDALTAAAVELATGSRAHLELRHTADRPIPLVPSLHKTGLVLDLAGGEEAVWGRMDKARRRQVRKARNSGLRVTVCGSEGLAGFNRILEANMRDLGSPAHRRGFARRIMDRFGPDARILLATDGAVTDSAATHDGTVIGAGLVLVHGDSMSVPWLAALRSTFSRAPNQLLYWEAIRLAIARGCRVFDFGRSSPGTGPYTSKLQWGAEPVQLYWHRLPGDEADDDVRRWQWATTVWRHLPVPVATAAGAAIRGRLPQ